MPQHTRRAAIAALAALPLITPSASGAAEPPAVRKFKGFDGADIAVRMLGEGRPTLLLHGFQSDGQGWFRSGLAGRLAAQGRWVIAPDFRGHGQSAAPTDPKAYPKDALALDQEALLKATGVRDFDVVGYSMGALVAVRLLARGGRPGKAVLGGMGLARVTSVTPRDQAFRQRAANDPAILGVLNSLGRTAPAELKRLKTPTRVISGDRDNDNGSAEELAAALGAAHAVRVPGSHGEVPRTAAFITEVEGFLSRRTA